MRPFVNQKILELCATRNNLKNTLYLQSYMFLL
nr:MAG TPA: hypothetical protein [Caudoviricetes sp.]